MFDNKIIKAEYLGLIGLLASYADEASYISPLLRQTDSGMYLSDFHQLANFANLLSTAPDLSDWEPATWKGTGSSSVNYVVGDVVIYQTVIYKAIADNYQINPAEDVAAGTDGTGTYWRITTLESEWTELQLGSYILKAVNELMFEKISESSAKNSILSETLFDGTGRFKDTFDVTGYRCGLEIVPLRTKGLMTRIKRVGLQFDTAGEYVIELHHSDSYDVIDSTTLTYTKAKSFQWFDLDWYFSYDNGDLVGGSYYITYRPAGIPEGSKPIRKDYDFSQKPCGTCNNYVKQTRTTLYKYIEVHPFRVDNLEDNMWDIDDMTIYERNNFGLNLDIDVYCDYTDILVDQKMNLVNYIGLYMAIEVLKEMKANSANKVGRHVANSRFDYDLMLNGPKDSYQKQGLIWELEKAKKAAKLNFNSLSRVCLPCGKKRVKYKKI